MASNPILTYSGEHLLGADDGTAGDVLLGSDSAEVVEVFGVSEPDSVLVHELLARLVAHEDADSDVFLGVSDGTSGGIFGFMDPPAVLEWGGVDGQQVTP